MEHYSLDEWLVRNLTKHNAITSMATHYNSFRLRVLPVMLLTAAVVLAGMWYQEARLGLITMTDRVAYPLMLLVCVGGAVVLKFRPGSLRRILAVVFTGYVIHLLAVYYQEMWLRISGAAGSSYELTTIALWLPLGYVGSFVFFSPRRALVASLLVYLSIAAPQLMVFATDLGDVERQLALAIILSQPVYIAALWGVAILKQHASGTHELAITLSDKANNDSLTGLANRHAMSEVLEAVMDSQQEHPRSVSLIIFDVDRFKSINDTYGHNVGDAVLIRLAQTAQRQQRGSDLIARWGGEEFMILALDETGEQAPQVAERLRQQLAQLEHPQVGRVTVSLGVTEQVPGEDLYAFIHRADVALYKAKEAGRNRVEGLFG